MQKDLLNLVGQALNAETLQKISDFLGEPISSVKTAFDLANASVLGVLCSNDQKQIGGEWIENLTKGGYDGNMLSNLGHVLAGGAATSGVLDAGSKFVNSLLGKRQVKLVGHISAEGKIGKGSASKILSMSGPIILNTIGKTYSAEAQNASSLSQLLQSQLPGLSKFLSPTLIEMLDLEDVVKPEVKALKKVEAKQGTTVAREKTPVTQPVSSSSDQIQKRTHWGWWIAVAALAILSIIVFRFCNNSTQENSIDSKAQMEDVQGDHSPANISTIESEVIETVSEVIAQHLENTDSGSRYFQLQPVDFDEATGELSLESSGEIEKLAEVLKRFPSSQSEIYAFVFDQVDSNTNQALSELRANILLQKLSSLGVESSQMSALGMGGQIKDDIPELKASNSVYLKIIKN